MTRHLLNLRFLHRRDQRDFVGTCENRTGLRPSSSYKCVLVIIILTISNLYSSSVDAICKQYNVLESATDFVGRCRSSLRSSWSSICRKWWISLADIRCILNCTAPVLASENFSSMYYLLRQREIHSLGKEKSSAEVNPLHFHMLGSWASLLLPHGSLLHARRGKLESPSRLF